MHEMCYKEVITENTCCEGLVCKQPGNPAFSVKKCCVDYDNPCEYNNDCCDNNAKCWTVPDSNPSVKKCCIKEGTTCTEADGGCCNGLLCKDGKCVDCLGQDLSCSSGGLGCCDGLVCMQPAMTYPYTFPSVSTCLP